MANGWIVKQKGGNLDSRLLGGCAIIGKVYFLNQEKIFNAKAQRRREEEEGKTGRRGSEGVGKRADIPLTLFSQASRFKLSGVGFYSLCEISCRNHICTFNWNAWDLSQILFNPTYVLQVLLSKSGDSMNIVEFLKLRGLDTKKSTKMIRHTDHEDYPVSEMTKEQLEFYQQCQSKQVFSGCDYVVSFLGIERTKARFFGVYKVEDEERSKRKHLPDNYPYPQIVEDTDYFYKLGKVSGFEDLEERIIIEWGGSTRAWAQNLTKKEVVEILPKGYVRSFPGYLDFILKFDELRKIVDSPDSNRVWHTMLSAVAGVYLIVDTKTDNQYVGSAYGKNGIMGRWTRYTKDGHGGNAKLQELLIERGSEYAANFSFNILQTVSTSSSRREVIARENIWKDKLGSRVFGLNLN